jgi:parallel beta-helix repeat protein
MNQSIRRVALFACLLFTSLVANAALNGPYTIGPGLATSTNYLTFSSAVSDMVSGVRADGGPANGVGVTGPVVFTVAAGTYNERILIPAITGASNVNTITFDGVDPLTRILTWTSTVSGDYTLRLNGADYIRVQNLGIANPGPSFGFGIQFLLSADNNIISGCKIDLPTTSTATGKVGICAGTTYNTLGLFASNLSLLNNTVIGGYMGIAVNGPSGTQATGLTMTGNSITDAYNTGLYVQYINLMVASQNTILMRTGYVSGYGVQLRYCSQFNFSRNSIQRAGLYGVYMIGTNFNMNNPANFTNNMVGGGFQTTSTSYGLYLTTNRFLNIYHNSVLCDNINGTGSRAVYVLGTSNDLNFLNNSFATTVPSAASYAMYLTSTTAIATCDFNNYYSAGSTFVYFQAAYANLAALQLGQPAYNQNCQAVWPNYLSNTNLHTSGGPLSNWATNIPAVTNDIDGQTRPLPPDLIKDVGADEFNVPLVDLDVVQLVNPVVPLVGSNSIQVMLQNNGGNSQNGTPVTLQYSTDGGTTWPVTQVFTPTTLGAIGTQETFTFTTPWVIASSGTYTFCVRISPQLIGDPDGSDQLCLSVCTGMGGTYTVNGGLATGGSNFNNFYDLSAALGGCGISAPVLVNVVPGVYNQSFTIGHINGVSSINTVTIDGGDTSLVTIQSSISVANGSVITLDSADYITFRNLKVNSVGVTYGSCFKLTNGANNVTIDSCALVMPNSATSAYHIGVLASGSTYSTYGNHANDMTVSNNVIRGGYYGIRINGTSTTVYCERNRILNNDISQYYYYGIYSYYQSQPEFIGNTITARTSGTFTTSSYGLYAFYAQGSFRIEDNVVHSIGSYAVYLSNGNGNNLGTGKIINNMIGSNFQTTGTSYGLYMTACRDIDILHNSIYLGNSGGYVVYVVGNPPATDSLRFVNNIFDAGGTFPGIGGRTFYAANPGAIQTMDYNLYHSRGSQFAVWGGITYVSFATWRQGAPNVNVNSLSDDPGFVGPTNLHLVCSPSDNLGTPMGILLDIDKQTRSLSTPDIGADEFTSITVSTSLGPDTAYCGAQTIYADTVAFNQFEWGVNQYLPFINVDTTGFYSVYVIDSNNCRAADTVFIVIDSLPTLPYDGDTVVVCNTTILDAQNLGSSYVWSNGAQTQTTTPAVAGYYFVTVTTPAGCSLTDSVLVNLNPNPTLELGPDTTFCLGAGAVLNAGSGLTGTTYQWNTGATTQIVVITSPGLYQVTVTSGQGCVSTDSVTMNILQAPVLNLGANHTACGPEILDAGNPGATYQWSTGSNAQTITVSTSGTYAVTVTNTIGCQTIDNITITMGSAPQISLGPNQLLCNGQTITLDAGNPGSTYTWSSGATSQSITVSTGGTYIVNVTNQAGCVGQDSITITQSTLSVNLGPNYQYLRQQCDDLECWKSRDDLPLEQRRNFADRSHVTQPGTYSVTVTDGSGLYGGRQHHSCRRCQVCMQASTAPATSNLVCACSVQRCKHWRGHDLVLGLWRCDRQVRSRILCTPYLGLGVYTVTLIVTDGFCRDTTTTVVDVNQYVKVDDASFAAAFEIYPNPSNGLFEFFLELHKRGDVSLTGDRSEREGGAYGRTTSRCELSEETLDLSALSKGVYILQLQSGENRIFKKLVIQ